jgi:predicted DNA-binding protein (UPF0251 family)
MPAKQSQEVRNAMQLVDNGASHIEAAQQAGVWPSTLYRALKAREKLATANKAKKKVSKKA